MRFNQQQLTRHLQTAQRLLPVYIVSGDETLLVQECTDAIRQACKQQGYSEREVMHVNTAFDWQTLDFCARSLSLFATKKLIELRLPGGKPGANGSKALINYMQKPVDDTVLLIITNKLDSATTRSKWYKAVEATGAAIQIWPIPTAQWPQWVKQRLAQVGLRASQPAVALLADRVEGNLLAAAQEIDKLRLLCDGDIIDVEQVQAAVSEHARYDVFALVDRALQGDARAALHALHQLESCGTDSLAVLWALSRELRLLARCAAQLESGGHIEQVLRQHRVWEKRKGLTRSALQRLSRSQLHYLLHLANDVDQQAKGMMPGHVWDGLQDMVLGLAGGITHNAR